MKRKLAKWAVAAPLLGLGVIAPFTYVAERGVTATEACADTLCCPEFGSICGELTHHKEHHYQNGDGSCPNT